MRYFYIILTITLTSCQVKTDNNPQSDRDEDDMILRKEAEVFGDTLKVIYEYHGDTVIQHRIDLKGTTDDGFDNSFTVKSVWSTKNTTDLTCSKKLKIKQDGVHFYFCLDDVIQKVTRDINTSDQPGLVDRLTINRAELINIKNGEADSLLTETYYLTFDLLQSIDFSIVDTKTKSKVKKVRIEQYETDFSGGNIYYLIGDKKDTLARFDVNDWIR
ncbi:MAG: hypothetical protein JST46_18035 [Bacteroidetes bacterium]|nr:hypothetical protein [Bacteroidota bacterium]